MVSKNRSMTSMIHLEVKTKSKTNHEIFDEKEWLQIFLTNSHHFTVTEQCGNCWNLLSLEKKFVKTSYSAIYF